MLKVSKATDIGLARKLNEDSILCDVRDVFVVADGMGGHAAGEVASHIFTATVEKQLLSDDTVLDEGGLRQIFTAGNEAILESIREHPERSGMGTTATMLCVDGKTAYWGHVGDSRLYLLRNGSLEQITTDHTYVAELLAAGSISTAEAMEHPNRNMLMRAVGVEENFRVDTGQLDILSGDMFLLCSDGLTNMVTLAAIKTILEASDCKDKAAALIDVAKAGGGLDNISAIVVEYYED